jgi:signal transduction histidine kinase
VPLTAGAAVVGGLELSFVEPRDFGASDREFLAALGRQGGLALERARLHADEVRAREEAELRASAAQALEFVAEGVFLVDGDGIVRVWNPSAAAVTGLDARTVVGRRLADVAPWWPPVAERVPVASAGDRGAAPLTLPLETEAGELWASILGIRFDEGVVYAFRDVTDEHGLERLKSDFIATISHELRTPLAVLYGGAVTLGRDDVEVPADDRRRMLEMMVAEGKRLERLVDGILVASSLESDSARYESQLFDATAVVREVVGELNAATGAAIELAVDADAGDRAVLGDRDHLRQIVANLVDNAVKYSPGEAGVHVTVATAGERLRIGVSDDGLGVAHADRERIFDKFFRADSQLTNGVRGTGLGLYIVRELVQRMKGQVWVEPRPERGSLFVVELPTQPATLPGVDPSA